MREQINLGNDAVKCFNAKNYSKYSPQFKQIYNLKISVYFDVSFMYVTLKTEQHTMNFILQQ